MTLQYLIMQILYWATFCALFSFSNPFLSSKGFSASIIGYTLSIASVVSVILQPYLTKLIYKHINITVKRTIVFSFIAMIISYFMVLFVKNDIVLITAYIIALAGLLNIQTFMYTFIFEYINAGYKVNFGLARGMGSITYSFMSLILGTLSAKYANLDFIIIFCLITTILALLSMYLFKPIPHIKKDSLINMSFKEFFLKYKKFCYILLGLTLIFTTHNSLNTFFKNILESINFTNKEVGIGYMIASFVELPIMVLIPLLSKKTKYSTLFKISAIGFSLKAFLTLLGAYSFNISVIYLAQLTQAIGFALYLPVSLYYANMILDENDKILGQSYLGITITLGGIIGNLFSGKLYESTSILVLLIVIFIISVLGTILIIQNTER